jgi:hypothetical protein
MMDAGVQDIAHGQHPDQLAAPDDRQVADPQLQHPVGGVGEFATDRPWRQWQPHRPDHGPTADQPTKRRCISPDHQVLYWARPPGGRERPMASRLEGPEHDHAVAGGQVDLGAGVGERFPLARRMAGSSRTDQPKARLATASEDRSETVLGTTGPDHARTPLSYSP